MHSTTKRFPFFLLALLASAHLALSAPAAKDVIGNWSGTLQISGVKLRLLFKIRQRPEGPLTGKLDSLDQGATDIPVDVVTLKEDKLHFEIKLIEGVYEGTLDSTGAKATGQWHQGGQSLPLTLTRGDTNSLFASNEQLSPADLAASKLAAEKLAGEWSATLKADSQEFHLLLNIKTNSNGAAAGTLDSLDQGLHGIPLSAITYKDGKVHFEARGMGATYEGVSFNDTSSVTGQWHQAGHILPLSFRKAPAKPAK